MRIGDERPDEGPDDEASDALPLGDTPLRTLKNEAARRLYDEYWEALCALIYKKTGDHQLSEQIALMAITEHLKSERRHINSQEAYLFTIALNLLKAHRAPRKRDVMAHVIDVGHDGLATPWVETHAMTDPLPGIENKIDLERVLGTLPQRLLHTVLLFTEGKTSSEVGKNLGVSAVTARRWWRKACSLLAKAAGRNPHREDP